MYKKIILTILVFPFLVFAQTDSGFMYRPKIQINGDVFKKIFGNNSNDSLRHISIMQEQSEFYKNQEISAEEYYSVNQPAEFQSSERSLCNLNKMVFGWHPYWSNGLEQNYQWNLISDFCYFSYEVNPATGNASSTHSWATINSVDTALARGLNVHLCVTMFSDHATFFGNATARNTLIQNLITTVSNRGAHGINIDFEGVPASQATNFNNFMVALSDSVHAHDPSMKVSMCLYSVDWSNVFNEPLLAQHVDFFTIMGYDYYYSGSTTAGPCDPLYGFSTGYDYSLSRSVTYYKNAGIPSNKLVLGLPYYGKEWETTSNTIPSSTTGNYTYSRTYKFIRDNTSGFYTNPVYNVRSVAETYVFQNAGTWRQSWIDEGYEMEKRYDLVNQRDLSGIGIWALGYDDGYAELWNAIENKLTDCRIVACSDTIYDGGGPEMNYYDNENYWYTISPDNAASVSLTFYSFATEAGFDSLFLYDGPDLSSPLIGAYTGNTSPGTVSSTGPHLTLRFKSDGATRAAGFMAVWNCVQDDQPPFTQVINPGTWITQDEVISFTDSDNIQLKYSFWNVADLNANGYWHSNISYGFCTDAFEENNGDWISQTGAWNINTGTLTQTDETNGNTNFYATVNQNNHDQYYYSWRARTGGTGNNRRSGFHFMCDDPALPNRGNSYFVWFRPDQSQLQFYEVTNDVFSLTHTISLTTQPNVWYDYEVIYDKLTGRMDMFVDNVHIGFWQDATPLTIGNGISFRSGNATMEVEEIKVFASRGASEMLTAGTNTDMIRFENLSPNNPAASISSLVFDDVYLQSSHTTFRNVDFTVPVSSGNLTDENPDVDTIQNTASFLEYPVHYSDPNSGIEQVVYAVGTTAGSQDIVPFTPYINGDSIEVSTNLFSSGTYYYVSTFAVNNAGLITDTISSDGFWYIYNLGINENSGSVIKVYPNPATDVIIVSGAEGEKLEIMDINGRVVISVMVTHELFTLPLNGLASGSYVVNVGKVRMVIVVK